MESRRMTAAKARISDIVNSKFIKGEGMNPSFVVTAAGRRLSRVRVLATVVDKFVSDSFSTMTLDDSSETMKAWAFKSSLLDDLKKGDIVDVVAKLKQYKEETYLLPEVVTVVTDPNIELLRELELAQEDKNFAEKRKIVFSYQSQAADLEELKKTLETLGISSDEVDAIVSSSVPQEESSEKEKILELIGRFDRGSGCDYTELLAASGMKEDAVDAIINELLADGACYEPRPGKIKRL